MASMISSGQNRPKKENLPINYLDSLCQIMSDEHRVNTARDIVGNENNEIPRDWYSQYLYKTYYSAETQRINVSEKQFKEGKVLRIAEGTLRWERVKEFGFGDEYNNPTEMSETEYFFLNNELLKISISKGHTDYNARPSYYGVVIRQLDLLCEKSKIVNRKAYWYSQLCDECVELYMREFDINENVLIQKAHTFYEKLTSKIKK